MSQVMSVSTTRDETRTSLSRKRGWSYKVVVGGVGKLLLRRVSQSRVWEAVSKENRHRCRRIDAISAGLRFEMRCVLTRTQRVGEDSVDVRCAFHG